MPHADLAERVRRYADSHNAPDTPLGMGFDGFTLVRCTRPTPFEPTLYRPLLCVVLQGRKETSFGRQRVSFGAGESLIVSLDLPTTARVTEASVGTPYLALALEIDFDVIRGLIQEVDESEAEGERACTVASGTAGDALIGAIGRLFDLVDKPLERRVLAPLVLREVHFRMLLAGHGGMLRRLASRHSQESRLGRAIARIRESFPRSLSVAELARTAAMSPSTFHEHFKTLTAMTPLQYQKELRLLEARQRSTSGRSVTEVAFDVGYESPSQFSREYARKFGKPPGADRVTA